MAPKAGADSLPAPCGAIACEPNCNEDFQEFPLVELNEILRRADIQVVLVGHDEFKEVEMDLLKEKVVIDTRGSWR